MPLYEYECENCQIHFTILKRVSESEESVKCPYCGSEKTRKIVSTFGLGSSNSCFGGCSSFG